MSETTTPKKGLYQWAPTDEKLSTFQGLNDAFEILDNTFVSSANGMLNAPSQSNISTTRTTTLALTSGVDTKILFTTIFRDIQSELNIATGEITLKESGVYLIAGNVTFSAVLGNNSYIKIYKNGASLFTMAGGTNQSLLYGAKIGQFAAGDKLTFYVAQFSGSAATLNTALIEMIKLS
ncbi:hypothetical protein [Neobacillus drentensis]|uniref:hypothetical protein n=1 Tax=Neobacillus drentensis TaxID=220684 RepID=UPI002FFD602B